MGGAQVRFRIGLALPHVVAADRDEARNLQAGRPEIGVDQHAVRVGNDGKRNLTPREERENVIDAGSPLQLGRSRKIAAILGGNIVAKRRLEADRLLQQRMAGCTAHTGYAIAKSVGQTVAHGAQCLRHGVKMQPLAVDKGAVHIEKYGAPGHRANLSRSS